MSLILNYETFPNICRTCLFIGKLRPIIDTVIIEIIQGLSGTNVKSDTELPQKICETCYTKIYKINEFALQCKRNETQLNKCKNEYLEQNTHEINSQIESKDEMIKIKEEIQNSVSFLYHKNRKPENIINPKLVNNFEEVVIKVEPSEFVPRNFESNNNNATSTEPTKNPDRSDRRIRDKIFCIYCKTTVLNFGRHITRNHLKESEVQQILSHPTGSKERKHLFSLLRKRGNYLLTKPVRRTRIIGKKFKPCVHCLGFYSSRQLWKHKKVCAAANNTKLDESIHGRVFPRMRADVVSLVAKQDPIICAFGARYFDAHHSETHIVNVTSRKMRELAKILIAVKQEEGEVKNLLDLLNPRRFEAIVRAVKDVARFDEKRGIFASPTYAIQMGPALRQCCQIALRDGQGDVEGLRSFMGLVDAKWKSIVPPGATCDKALYFGALPTPKRVLVPWSPEQKHVVDEFFCRHIREKKPPKKTECDVLSQMYPALLQNKSWLKIKVYVQNKYSK